MVQVTLIESNGNTLTVEGPVGETLMHVAVEVGVTGIIGDCGGACSCATCHCYIDEGWADKLTEPDPIEAQMISCAIEPRETSRLSCQITLGEELDGLVVHLPVSQY